MIDSRTEAEPGKVSISASAGYLIDVARCPVLVLPRSRSIAFGSSPAGRARRLARGVAGQQGSHQHHREVDRAAEEVAQRARPEPRLQAARRRKACPSRHPPHGIVAAWPSALNTRVTELGDSRVRVEVQVPPDEVEERLQRTARQLGRDLKLPGFRRGKVPAPLVIQRVGREAVLEEAVRETLSSWYSDAIESAGIVPVGDPKVDLGELPAAGTGAELLDRDRRAAEGEPGGVPRRRGAPP